MKTNLTFDELCKMLKTGESDGEVLSALDAMSGALMVLGPAALGIPAASVFGLFGVKNELVKAGRFLVRKVSGRTPDDKLTRHDLVLAVYCLSCYTAFFEAAARAMPDILKSLEPSDRVLIAGSTLRPDGTPTLLQQQIDLPRANVSVEETADQLAPIYVEMAVRLASLISQLSVWEEGDDVRRDHLVASTKELPELAKKLFKGQYLALSVTFPEFQAWANQRGHGVTHQKVDQVAADVRVVLELLSAQQDNENVDIGLASLGAALTRVTQDSLDEVLNGLGRYYRAEIDQPVIDDSYTSNDGVDLRYPKKSEIFVPQAFRALSYHKGQQLEDESLWESVPTRHDIGAYLLSYLASPYSLDLPLIVLGQPGSGKSLLTEILAARLASAEYHPVRVKLRDINPDSDIQDQIEEQIRDATGRDVNWAELSARCDRPPLVLLDGYDELLQASGKVFGNYLRQVAGFQRREQIQGRPVRVIVTSRVTLIDKADVPVGTTIVRLADFDAERQEKWVRIWNDANQPYFQANGVRPFTLPQDGEIQHLVGQPLLLLMLALYDSDKNKLSEDRNLKQTVLYHNLLIRFITRERMKDEEFRVLSTKDQESCVLDDLKRLSVAAIGMFNRRALHIAKDDLQRDIEYFGAPQESKPVVGVPLSQAELLLGSFFFVHESRSQLRSETANTPAAYEFLHNTFGEFLTAEWLIATALDQTEPIALMQKEPALAGALHQLLNSRDGLPNTWFATLMVTPLFSRPVVLHMLREWSAHRLLDSVPNFTAALEVLLYSQLKRILSDAELPTMLLAGDTPFPRAAALTNLATYTLNLVLLRCVIGGPFQVDIDRLRSEAFPKPWTNLLDLWRAGLGRDWLAGVATILIAHVNDDGVRLAACDTFTVSNTSYLGGLYALGKAIGDDQLTALSGWALQDVDPMSSPSLQDLAALPSIHGTKFRHEIRARALLRDIAEHGQPRLWPSWASTLGPTASSDLLTTMRSPHQRRPDHTSALELNFLAHTNAELAERIWNSDAVSVRVTWDRDFELLKHMLMARPILTANMTARDREQHLRRPGSNSSGERPQFANLLITLIQRLTDDEKSTIPTDVRYELIASGYEIDDMTTLLGRLADVWAIGRRPRSTILTLLELSTQRDLVDWIRATVETFALKEGIRLMRAFGSATILTILCHPAAWTARTAHDNEPISLRGLASWAVGEASPSEFRPAVEEYVRLVATSPTEWLNHIEAPVSEMKKRAEELASAFGDELSVSAMKSLQVLRERTD
ncbi:NACHT domain-containing protein [Actinocrispum wychmicini]|uniref:AAA+ ATPase domain-containing protein n=1 Tax=Actinocrispum wychmicini TaxID=1213861 RepID=A0A4R2IX74_9PSEU|nr:ATP-binding protein [Actinocrispum wychmicini]TCO48868.1 hypothetical protein EV192_11589 [Actinocrispum wychmicini]